MPGSDVTLFQEASITAALLNTATASGNPADAGGADLPGFADPSAEDTAEVALFAPGLAIEKSPDLQVQQAVAGVFQKFRGRCFRGVGLLFSPGVEGPSNLQANRVTS